jgi:hypothetical protein
MIVVVSTVSKEEVEAVIEADAVPLKPTNLGGGCAPVKWSRSASVEPTKLHSLLGQRYGAYGHVLQWPWWS